MHVEAFGTHLGKFWTISEPSGSHLGEHFQREKLIKGTTGKKEKGEGEQWDRGKLGKGKNTKWEQGKLGRGERGKGENDEKGIKGNKLEKNE